MLTVYAHPDAQFRTAPQRIRCARYWKEQYEELKAAIEEDPSMVGERDFREFKLMGDFHRHVSDILAVMNDIVQPHRLEELERYGFDDAAGDRKLITE
jgi:hypothetical protein